MFVQCCHVGVSSFELEVAGRNRLGTQPIPAVTAARAVRKSASREEVMGTILCPSLVTQPFPAYSYSNLGGSLQSSPFRKPHLFVDDSSVR